MNATYYATLERKVSERVIERAYESSPSPNDDGTIDHLTEMLGQWEVLSGFRTYSYENAENYFKRQYPTIWEEDSTRIVMHILK